MQLTIIKIIGYGPWTLTLGSDREHELQMLQASLYKEIQVLFSKKNCLVFLNRADEFFVISNGVNLDEHIMIQQKLAKSFDLQLSMSIGCAENPFDANRKAYEGKQLQTILNNEYHIYGYVDEKSKNQVTIMHLDVEDLTSVGKTKSPYEISFIIFKLYSRMSEFFLKQKSLTFFMGGDNFMIISSDDAKRSVKDFLDIVKKDGITINCGIGTGQTGREAVKLATKSLDTIREIRDSGKKKSTIYELSCF